MQAFTPRVIVQPDDGVEPVRQFVASAEKSLLLKQFTFTEESLLETVIERHDAGVDVRVMLNPARSGGDRANDDSFTRLQAAGVNVAWTNPKFYVTHEKSIVVDGQAALVATFNLCEKYFTLTRDYGVVTTVPQHVAQIVDAFDADWEHRDDWHPAVFEGLLWSNSNSRYHMAQFIDAARHRLDIQHPKYVDAVILDHIAAAAGRGVKVRVLCGGKHGISEWDILDTFASLRTLRRFGVKVHKQKNLRVHAKLLIADDAHALVGSMNIDRSAFDLRRELGVIVEDSEAVARLGAIFAFDWESSHQYEPPDPLRPGEHGEDDFPHDPDLMHE
ncbi:cardiolipin synthase [Mycolicibacterium fluoranthenivorans]|jgi:phosphatidylserine/phosphatidylglycerophosphate/cardiolipin synthase-like enzyme|uniref:phospholipase D n=1 Tax=Mycolicibacterium fluoranthenivorans TaxID=258505 RepID=A0A1G4VLQ4_9MYCO|nr:MULTISPECIES: phospholipase D-like domain-containing protein [Mycobacteriaceae]MCV7254277.1 cardiolipin synthase [Mycobacterium hackensackense]QNJ92571.1 cardiolipin synthase [Mycolicibacterium fluoranthenivorans]SCX08631.1 Phosphatidylserine/phosphatidylglycerophosphate/cardiolipin synthase [Mycolicibacterium fluoranthenivorans]